MSCSSDNRVILRSVRAASQIADVAVPRKAVLQAGKGELSCIHDVTDDADVILRVYTVHITLQKRCGATAPVV